MGCFPAWEPRSGGLLAAKARTLAEWLRTLSAEQRAVIQLFAMDMHRTYWNAIDSTPGLEHATSVHHPFHIPSIHDLAHADGPAAK